MPDMLFPTEPEQYGDQYANHLMDQYKLFVDSAEKNSDRRLDVHKYFATLNAALLTTLGVTLQFGNYASRMDARLAVAIVGLLSSVAYGLLIRSYKNLGRAKFDVIHRIEQKLPLALFKTEWSELREGKHWWHH